MMTPIRMERLESGVRAILALTEAINRRDLPAIQALLNDECIFETPSPAPNGEILRGKSTISSYWQAFFAQFPQAHFKLEEAFGLGMHCVSRWSCERTDPSGHISHVRGIDLFRIQDGLIIEHFSYIKG